MNKPNCYECKHRGSVPGSAHSTCDHPGVTDFLVRLLTPVALANGVYGELRLSEDLIVKGAKTGIRGGWFHYPIDFDPVWVESCTGFEAKQSTAVSDAINQAA